MATKYKMTGCARFVLVLLILIPVAYFTASYITGQDGIKFIRDLFGAEPEQTEIKMDNSLDTNEAIKDINELKDQLINKDEEIQRLQKKNQLLHQKLDSILQDTSERINNNNKD